jgi:hypothetical protein
VRKTALLVLVALTLTAAAAFAQAPAQYPLLDFQHRMSIGGRLYRSFDERPAIAASYTSSWWAGVPVAYILTGRQNKDGSVNPIPLSLIGALDIGLQGADQKRIRGYVGITALFKSVE